MEVENNELTPEPVEQTTEGEPAPNEVTPDPQTDDNVEGGDPQPWEPDYKVKVLDEEHEIPEEMRGVITKDNYDQFKELYEKAYGLDHFKKKHDALNSEYTELKTVKEQWEPEIQEFHKYKKGLSVLDQMREKKDYDNLFAALKISEQDVMDYAGKRLQYNELPPEQQQAYNQQIEQHKNAYYEQQNTQQMQYEMQNQAASLKKQQLDLALMQPDVAKFREEFDSRMGVPGSLQQQIVERGQLAYHTQGKDLSPMEVITEIMAQYKPFLQSQASDPVKSQEGHIQRTADGKFISKEPVETLPKVPAGNAGPVKPAMTLKRLRELQNSSAH